jgi:quercetin dioxygenase-like cupin family protein
MMAPHRPKEMTGDLDNALTETLLHSVAPAELCTALRTSMRARVLRQARETPPDGTSTLRSLEGTWMEYAPRVQVKVLRIDAIAGNQTILMKMQPGGVIPAHRHEKEEEFIVLEGECHVGAHLLCAGDAHIAAAGSWHEEVTTRTGVLVMLRGEYPPPTRQPLSDC